VYVVVESELSKISRDVIVLVHFQQSRASSPLVQELRARKAIERKAIILMLQY
jgi:hypothetical protein